MVDGIKAAGMGDPVVPVTRVATAQPPAPVVLAQPHESASGLAALARSVANSAPVDTDRVARIKQAIVNGTFPILPATIADRLMAFRYEWMTDDKA